MFTIYTKSGCPDCDKVKNLLSKEKHILINCDQLLKNNRSEFIKSMELKIHRPFKSFPVVFLDDVYIGGYDDVLEYLTFSLDENDIF